MIPKERTEKILKILRSKDVVSQSNFYVILYFAQNLRLDVI